MAKSTDRKRVSSQKHEVSYTGKKVASKTKKPASKGKAAVKTAKKQLGRKTSRGRVERRATSLARK